MISLIKYYVLIRRIIWLLGFIQRLFFDKEQIVSQTNLFPSLGYFRLKRELF